MSTDSTERLRKAAASAKPFETDPRDASVSREEIARSNGSAEEDQEKPDQAEEQQKLPEEAWRGIFGDYRRAMEGTSEAPDAAHFLAIWAWIAARLRRRVFVEYAYRHYPNGYFVFVGATGDSKTSAQRAVQKLPNDGRVKILRGIGSAEALGDWMMQGDGPVSHLLSFEELGGLLIRGGWEGSTLLQFLTETFDAPDVHEVRFRKNPIRVVEPTPTLRAGTTPEWFWKGMREIDFHGGFGNRLFFLSGQPKPPIALPEKPDPHRLGVVTMQLERLDDLPAGETTLSDEAMGLWKEFYLAWKRTERTLDPLTHAATRRIHTYALKLALTYAAAERTVPTITAEQVAAAILVANFGFKCAAQLVHDRQEFSAQGRCERAVVSALRAGSQPAWKIHHEVGGRFTADDVSRALRALKETGAVFTTGQTTRGTPIYSLRGGRDA